MRKVLLPALIIIAAALLVLRIFYLQIIDDTFKLESENNAIKIKYDYPERGYIYDRFGKLLVANQASYDIMVIPREINNLDTLEFCQLLNIQKEDFIKNIEKAQKDLNKLEKKYRGREADRDAMMAKSQEMLLIYKKYDISPL